MGPFQFGLSGSGDSVKLFDARSVLVDEVTYDDDDPWPEACDGDGATLALRSPALDNDIPDNWFASPNMGTPGFENNMTAVDKPVPCPFVLHQNYPNPCNSTTQIAFSLQRESRISLSVYNIAGQRIMTLIDGILQPGYHTRTINLDAFSSGIYAYQLTTSTAVERRKMLVIK